ncbi:MAG: DUF5665 domain-containing protein [Fimbriimonadaceae bacterium]
MEDESVEIIQRAWVNELKRGNDLTAELLRLQKDWKHALRQGMVTGLGGVLGATLLVSLLLSVLKPFERLEMFKPSLERIAEQLERRPAK